MPLLSRGAINSSTSLRSNFTKLAPDSRCDNVLLEYNLAFELRERGLIEFVFPIMLGDTSNGDQTVDSEVTYANYFKQIMTVFDLSSLFYQICGGVVAPASVLLFAVCKRIE